MGKRVSGEFFAKKASLVAPKMLGLKLCTPQVSVGLCEVEAYEGKNDPASHAYTLTKRSQIMLDTYGHWYVYFIYGNHYCLNITCGKGEAGAVLIREAIPLKGIELMKKRRKLDKRPKKHSAKIKKELKGEVIIKGICDGPGKLCEALGIDKKFNGLGLGKELWLEEMNLSEKKLFTKLLKHNQNIKGIIRKGIRHKKVGVGGGKLKIVALPRIGISKAKEKKWRFRLVAKVS